MQYAIEPVMERSCWSKADEIRLLARTLEEQARETVLHDYRTKFLQAARRLMSAADALEHTAIAGVTPH
ncbi:MAG TPA: hypothetical protein VGF97_15790 [Rhizomicrobium sp.]|jgi:hypothetical protein